MGERVRLQGGPLAGQIEGTVSSLGLLYTTFATGDDSIMVPNSVVLNVAVLPLREPEAVNLRARLRAGMTPGDLQEILEKSLQTPLRDAPRITLEELDGDEVVVRIAATPRVASQGRLLASELLSVGLTRDSLAGGDAVAQEQVGVALERPPAAPARAADRAPLRRGSAAPRRALGSPPRRTGASERKSSSTRPVGEQLRAQVRAALAQQRSHAEARAQLAPARPAGRAAPGACRAHVVHLCGARWQARG